MHKLLQGLEMGDTVMFVTAAGETCPATLLCTPGTIAFKSGPGSEEQERVTATVLITGTAIRTNALYSAAPETGCWFLSEKQQWMMDNWNIWQNGNALVESNRQSMSQQAMPDNGTAPSGWNETAHDGPSGITMARFADGPMGGPIQGGARPEVAMQSGAMQSGMSPPEERDPEMAGAASSYGTPPP